MCEREGSNERGYRRGGESLDFMRDSERETTRERGEGGSVCVTEKVE